ncbi:hypothetical protein [Nocardioides pacificus]
MSTNTVPTRSPRTRSLATALTGLLAAGAVVSLAQLAPADARPGSEVSSSRATAAFTDAAGDIDHGADLHRVRVVNNRQVKVRVTHADLRPSWRSGSSLAVYLDTDSQQAGPEFAFVGGTYQGSDYALVPTDGWRLRQRAVPMRCSYDLSLDYAADTADVRIARRCLDLPDAIRVAVKTGGTQADGDTVVDWLGRRRQLTRVIARG